MNNYPSRVPNRIEGTGEGLFKREIPVDYNAGSPWATSRPRLEVDPLVYDPQQNYVDAINKAFNVTKTPLNIDHYGNYLQVDHNWDNFVDKSNHLRTPNGTRLGYAHSTDNLNPAQPDFYGAGIDNLTPVLGDNYYSKSYNLPLGMTADIEYDGDGTLAGGINVPSRQYYAAALMNLLNKR